MSGYDPNWGQVEHSGDLYSQTDRDLARNSKAKTPSLQRLKKEDAANTNIEARGMGKTELTRRYLTDAEKMFICLLRGKGLTNAEIAIEVKRPETTIANVFRQVEKASQACGLNYDWRQKMLEKAIPAVMDGLDCTLDPYKRMKGATDVLKGLGEFERDGSIDIARLVNGIPPGHEARYITIVPEPPQLEESTDNDQPPAA